MDAIIGLIGVIVGAFISQLHPFLANRRVAKKNARYLAIRVVCILDTYVLNCAEVINDDGLRYGETIDGYRESQVVAPGAPVFPEDVDWKSIETDIMYEILSFPADVEAADRLIKSTSDIAVPPDYKDWFEERKFWYSQFGLRAIKLSEKLSKKYDIQPKVYYDWDPKEELTLAAESTSLQRQKRIAGYQQQIDRTFGK